MSYFKIVVPEAVTNLFTDPRFAAADPDTAYDITGDGASPDVTRVTTDQWIGNGCASFDISDGTLTTMTLTITATNTSYTLSAMIKRAAGGTLTNTQTQVHFDTTTGDWDSITARRDNWYLCVKTGTATAGSRAFGVQALEAGLLSDAWQLENNAYRTTYTDGSLTGHRADGYRWNGTVNNSTSNRHAQERSGGRIKDVEDDLNVHSVTGFSGWGKPASQHILQEFASIDGADYQNSKLPPRLMDLSVVFSGTSLSDMHTDRGAFLDAISIHKTTPKQPFEFRYTGASREVKINGREAGGMEGETPQKNISQAVIRILCEDPYWKGLGNQGIQLDVRDTDTNYYFALRQADGTWTNLGGANGEVRTIIRDSVGNILIGGDFTTVNGVTARRVAIYTLATGLWTELGDGLQGASGAVRAIALTSTGIVYVGGDFTEKGGGGGTLRRLVSLSSITDTTFSEVDSGLGNDGVYTLVVDSNDDLYIGGGFISDGPGTGGNIRRYAKLTSGTIAEVDSGLNGIVYSLAINSSDNVYIGGDFTANGAGAGTKRRFAKDVSGTVTEENSGMNDTVRAIHRVSNTLYYLGGDFTADGASAGTYNRLVSYNGSSYTDLASGLTTANEDVHALTTDSTGNLYIGGDDWTSLNSRTVTEGLGVYDGTNFNSIDLSFSTVTINAINWYNGELAIGGSVSTAAFGGNATATNNGSVSPGGIIKLTGPGVIYSIVNKTTSTSLYFDNLTLATSEILTIDLDALTVKSDVNGDLSSKLRSGSNLADFTLVPGSNVIYGFIDNASATGVMTWNDKYSSVDDV